MNILPEDSLKIGTNKIRCDHPFRVEHSMKNTIPQLELFKKEIRATEPLKAPNLGQETANYYALVHWAYTKAGLDVTSGNKLRTSSCWQLKRLTQNCDEILLTKGFDFLKSELLTALSLVLAVMESDAEALDQELGMIA